MILVIADHYLITAHRCHKIRIRMKLIKIRTRAHPGKDAYGKMCGLRIAGGILKRMPRTFQEHSPLRIETLSLTRIKTKKGRVEHLCIIKPGSSIYELRVGLHNRIYARCRKLLRSKTANGFNPAAQVRPEL